MSLFAMLYRACICTIVLMLASTTSSAQRRGARGARWTEPLPSWGIESSIRASVMKDDAVRYVGGRVGRQFDRTFNLGVGGSFMLTNVAETFSAGGFERVTSLVYLGPSIELRDSLRGPVRFLLRTTAVAGFVGYDDFADSVATSGTSLMYGFEPEIGVNIRLSRALQVNATVGALFAWRVDGGRELVSAPTAALGLRIVR